MRFTVIAIALGLAMVASAQMQDNQPSLTCNDNNNDRGNSRVRHCEMKEQSIAYGGQLNVDGLQNGGVSVKGWNRADVMVRAKVEGWGSSDAEASAIAGQVRLNMSAGRISADGPNTDTKGQGWSVSYELMVPHQANVDIKAHNGGVHITDVAGNINFSTVNGGVHLARVDGNVRGTTTNGGVHIELAGSRWNGQGLDVTTTNGGVHMDVPANYSAHIDTATVNGGLDAPGAQPEARKAGKFSANLGSGGATLHVATTNGGVKIRQI
jgi:DUF4097 and DUF4098 domain-containing protein YvlB